MTARPALFGVGGQFSERAGVADLSGVSLPPGSVQALALRTAAVHLQVDGRDIPTTTTNGLLRARLVGAGQPLPHYLDVWQDDAGRRFDFPRHAAWKHLRLRSHFVSSPALRTHLSANRPVDPPAMDALVGELQAKGWTDPAHWTRPDRLWLVIPFTDAQRVGGLKLRVDGQPQPLLNYTLYGARIIWYADLSAVLARDGEVQVELELSDLGADQFLGPYLDLSSEIDADRIEAAPAKTPPRLVYDGIVPNPPDPNVAPPMGLPPPRILSVALEPSELREGGSIIIHCQVEQAAADLQGVYASTFGGLFGMPGDLPLVYDVDLGCWTLTHDLPPRRRPDSRPRCYPPLGGVPGRNCRRQRARGGGLEI